MANWESLRVSEVISDIKDGRMVLPVIQRHLVWDAAKMELLFNSLLRGNSFGAIICIEEEKGEEPLFASRKFSDDGEDRQSSEDDELPFKRYLIVDGQQRLQSFYIGLSGRLGVKTLYFDLLTDFSNGEFDFQFNDGADGKLPSRLSEDTETRPCLWYPAPILYAKLAESGDDADVAEDLVSKLVTPELLLEAEEFGKRIERNIRSFFNTIFVQTNIGLSKVKVNKKAGVDDNRQKIVELFRRLNDGGTRLSSFDLVASILKGFDAKMEGFLRDVVAENESIGLEQEELINLLFILRDEPRKKMTELTAVDARFATEHSKRIRATLTALRHFLNHARLANYYNPSNNRSFIPLYLIAYHLFYSSLSDSELIHAFDKADISDKDFAQIKRWLYISLLNGVFSRGCGWIPYTTGIRKLHAVLADHKGALFPTAALFDVYRRHPLHVFEEKITASALTSFNTDLILYLIYLGSPRLRAEDIDHMHSKTLLQKGNRDDHEINDVRNYQLLDVGTNRGAKSGKSLLEFIDNDVAPANLQIYLDKHLVPRDRETWTVERYDHFLDQRGQLIANRINELLT